MKAPAIILALAFAAAGAVFLAIRPDQCSVRTDLQGRTMSLYGEHYTIKWAVERKGKFQYTLVKPGITLDVWEGNPGLKLQPTN